MTNAKFLRDLPMSEQMFLWSVRHIVCACEDRQPVCPLVSDFFNSAGLPKSVELITSLLRTLGASARQTLLVNVPCGVEVMPDELALLNGMRSAMRQPYAELPHELVEKIERPTQAIVAQRLLQVGRQFEALDAMRGPRAQRATTH